MIRIKSWVFTPQVIICYIMLAMILAFVAPNSRNIDPEESRVYVNETPTDKFRAVYMINVFGKFQKFDETIHIIDVELGHKTGDIIVLNDQHYKLLEPIGEGGDILPISSNVKLHSPNYYYGEVIYPDYVQDDTLVVTKPKLLNALIRQATTDGEIARALALTTRRY